MKKVFLGGTCNGSTWRDIMQHHLANDGLSYFNPVVDDWNDEAQKNELHERQACDYVLYTLTPKMTGTYSIAEVVDDSNKRPRTTIMVVLREDGADKFDDHQIKSLNAVGDLVVRNGGKVFYSLKSASIFMRDRQV